MNKRNVVVQFNDKFKQWKYQNVHVDKYDTNYLQVYYNIKGWQFKTY
jgi:hypothetical protein